MTGEHSDARAELVAFLRSIQKTGRPVDELSDTENLCQSGLIDLLAVVEILCWLESTRGIDFAERGVDTEQLSTIGGILAVMEG